MESWADRVEKLLANRGISIADLARLAGVDYDRLYKAIKRRAAAPRGDFLARIARALDTNERDLRFGVPTFDARDVPLLDMLRIGSISSKGGLLQIWDGLSRVSIPPMVSLSSFAVTLIDDSCHPELSAGDLVIFDPDLEPIPGRFVVATVQGIPHGLVRRFRQTDPLSLTTGILEPVNPAYPNIVIGPDNPGLILGRAVAHHRLL